MLRPDLPQLALSLLGADGSQVLGGEHNPPHLCHLLYLLFILLLLTLVQREMLRDTFPVCEAACEELCVSCSQCCSLDCREGVSKL